jgi:pyrroloquinoline quinone biosynthesis protein B
VDYAFLDATFYSGKELNNRDMSDIPHPSILESLEAFEGLSRAEREKVIFIHFNHTNPVAQPGSTERKHLTEEGFRLGAYGAVFEL